MANNENENQSMSSLMSCLEVIESSLSEKLPEMDHAIQALTTIVTEIDSRLNNQESILAMLLSKCSSSNEGASSSNSSLENGKPRGKVIF